LDGSVEVADPNFTDGGGVEVELEHDIASEFGVLPPAEVTLAFLLELLNALTLPLVVVKLALLVPVVLLLEPEPLCTPLASDQQFPFLRYGAHIPQFLVQLHVSLKGLDRGFCLSLVDPHRSQVLDELVVQLHDVVVHLILGIKVLIHLQVCFFKEQFVILDARY